MAFAEQLVLERKRKKKNKATLKKKKATQPWCLAGDVAPWLPPALQGTMPQAESVPGPGGLSWDVWDEVNSNGCPPKDLRQGVRVLSLHCYVMFVCSHSLVDTAGHLQAGLGVSAWTKAGTEHVPTVVLSSGCCGSSINFSAAASLKALGRAGQLQCSFSSASACLCRAQVAVVDSFLSPESPFSITLSLLYHSALPLSCFLGTISGAFLPL